ncbi:MAG: sulfatase-like hydrolase/transferase [Eubacteriales bacterium]|nr:sulfatase-like hydrolase/transferase [Eubacteriales bacterium]
MSAQDRPNILLITTDQQRFDTINALGNPFIYTPHFNWLTDVGVTFTNCYADCPICMPSRATIMTGRHGYDNHLVENDTSVMPMRENATLPGLLTRAGYQTRAQGKMHFEPMRANYGFEHMELPMDYYRARNRNTAAGRPKAHGVGENEVEPVISTVPEEESEIFWTVERSIDFLETRDETRPFFLWTSFAKPHCPFDPSLNYWQLYQNRPMPQPIKGDWSEHLKDIPPRLAQSMYILSQQQRLSPSQREDSQRAYYACITQIDYTLGLLFARMREMGLLDNTWILFTSDHGDMMGDHGLGAKSVHLEGSAHVPLIVCPPAGHAFAAHSGERCAHLADLADIMPTVLGIAGVEQPESVQGMDLRALAQDAQMPERTLYGDTAHELFMVRDARYKYIYTPCGGRSLLFDLQQDPHETHDLSAQAAYAPRRAAMHAQLVDKVAAYAPDLLREGDFIRKPEGSHADHLQRWPGFHSTVFPTDVLH